MTTEFNLSDKVRTGDVSYEGSKWFYQEDVKMFIRLLKEIYIKEITKGINDETYKLNFLNRLDKLAGDKLI